MLSASFGCAPKRVPLEKDDYSCTIPPIENFTSVGVGVSVEQISVQKFALGKFAANIEPKLVSIASKLSQDGLVRDYHKCLAKHRDNYNNEQINYMDSMNALLQTGPTSEEFINWHAQNPFPKEVKKK